MVMVGQHKVMERQLNPEKIKHHISHLEEKHTDLNTRIDQMERTGVFDDIELEALKKERLHLKDEIERNKSKLA